MIAEARAITKRLPDIIGLQIILLSDLEKFLVPFLCLNLYIYFVIDHSRKKIPCGLF